MKVELRTTVKGNYKEVMHAFDRDLFEALAPSLAKVKIEKFTGSKKGDIVHLKFLFPIKTEWISHITEDNIDSDKAYFIDKGVTLPFPLKFWEHHHIVKNISSDTCEIIDKMYFKSYNLVMDTLLYPFIYLGFYPRKKIYRKYFGKV